MTDTLQGPYSSLPTGTLTFLFTDIEGSTRLWELYPDQMRIAMVRHDQLIENAVLERDGMLVRPRGEGDSRFAVFTRATNALCTADTIQRRFISEAWAIPSPIRIRIALHTGEADLRDGDYYGAVVNRCARLRSVAHGGQILLSQSTYSMVTDVLPEGASLRDLGEFKLKDLKRAERIYQLICTGLPRDFPPIKSQDTAPMNLPATLTSFIGREHEMEEVKQLLALKRMLTITGLGGAGKSRLATQIAADVSESYSDGVWLVDFTPLSDTALVTQLVMNTLGIREEGCCPPIQTLKDYFRDKSLLLILDNCEHLLPDITLLVDTLIRAAPKLKILATSREPLGVMGEMAWSIPALTIPRLKEEIPLDQMLQYEAIKLFIDRAVGARSDFALTKSNVSAVAQICARLDGIPLAIELAAARAKVLSVEEIAERLDDRFQLLVNHRTATPRQRTLRNMIDWSYDLLPEDERTLLMRLSVFKGGWSLQAAEEVCSDDRIERIKVLDLLAYLVDKSLVIAETQDGRKRFRFLETIRQYAQERLAEGQEIELMASKHAQYYMKMAADSYSELWGPRQGYWLPLLEVEHDNLRSALGWMAQDPDRKEIFLRTAGSLWRFWEIHGFIREGLSWLDLALRQNQNSPTFLRANGLRGAGRLVRHLGDYLQAKIMHEESLTIFREIGEQLGIARELDALGEIAQYQGDYSQAIKLHNDSLAIRRKINDKEGIAVSLGQLGVIARDQDDNQRASELLEESLKLFRELEDKIFIAQTLNNLGLVERSLCEYEHANNLFEEAVALYREMNDKQGISNVLHNQGYTAIEQGEFKLASALFKECLDLNQELGDKLGIARSTVSLSEVAFYQGNYPLALDLASKSFSLFRELGFKRGLNHAQQVMAAVAVYQGEYDLARSLAMQCLALSTEINSPRAIGFVKASLGLCDYAQGDLDKAKELFLESLTLFKRVKDRRNIAFLLVNLARTAYRQDDPDTATQYLEDALSIANELETLWIKSFVLEIMGLLKRSKGQYEHSLDLFLESLSYSVTEENQQGIANCLGALAGLAVLSKQPARAAMLFAAAGKMRNAIGARMGNDDRLEYEHYLVIVQGQMDHQQFESAWAQGFTMTLDELVGDLNDWRGVIETSDVIALEQSVSSSLPRRTAPAL